MFSSVVTLIEKLVDEKTKNKVYDAIMKAQDLFEASWDGNKYTKTHNDIGKEVIKIYNLDGFWCGVISDLNHYYWNDIQFYIEDRRKI